MNVPNGSLAVPKIVGSCAYRRSALRGCSCPELHGMTAPEQVSNGVCVNWLSPTMGGAPVGDRAPLGVALVQPTPGPPLGTESQLCGQATPRIPAICDKPVISWPMLVL